MINLFSDVIDNRSLKFPMRKHSILLLISVLFSAPTVVLADADKLGDAAERYVRLGLELGQYDKDYVDAYLGPKAWQEAAKKPRAKNALASAIASLLKELQAMSFEDAELAVRHKALYRNVRAMDARVRMVNGEKFSFAEEARLIYDVKLPSFDFAEYDRVLGEIDALLPGEGDLAARMDEFRSSFNIKPERLGKVFDKAIDECRTRTKKFISMPQDESFKLEYVTGKSWSGYNWYQGNNLSLMQINQDFPTKIYGAVGLGCHEGYPGHHLWNVLVEEELIKDKGWIEFNLYPLFSPYGLIAEGSAEYGVDLAFPGSEKTDYEQDVLYPLANIDTKDAKLLDKLNALSKRLKYSRIAIAQRYLDGEIGREEALDLTIKYSLVSEKRAESSIKFLDQYRAYVLNYSLGEDLIASYIAARSKTQVERWSLFKKLLTELNTASDLVD